MIVRVFVVAQLIGGPLMYASPAMMLYRLGQE